MKLNIKDYEGKMQKFFAFYLMTFGVTVGLAFSANMLTMYLCYEALTFITLPLVTHSMDKRAEYAGKKYDEVDGVFLDMYIDKNEDGDEIMPTFYIDDENINANIGYKYKVKGGRFSEGYKFFKTNLIVKGVEK